MSGEPSSSLEDGPSSSERIERLLAEIRASADPTMTARVEELVEQVVGIYGSGLSRIWRLLQGERGRMDAVRRDMTDDPLISALLTLHGLHPDDVVARVEAALEQVRPYLAAHAGGVALLGLDDRGTAYVRLEGSCDGCTSSSATLRELVERAIQEAAPEIARVELEPGPALVSLGLHARQRADPKENAGLHARQRADPKEIG
jgi:Fe-S cluster biogenesis protein NfuA